MCVHHVWVHIARYTFYACSDLPRQSLLHFQRTGHCQYPILNEWMWVKPLVLITSLPVRKNMCQSVSVIFNIFLSQQSVPTCFKTATIVPVPKKACHVVLTTSLWLSPRWNTLKNWFFSTLETSSQPAWTLTSVLSEPTDLQYAMFTCYKPK